MIGLLKRLGYALMMAVVLTGFRASAADTERQYLSGRGKDDAVPWRFFCTTGALSGFWTNLPVPSNWELHGFGHLNYSHDPTNAWTERGLYEREFTLPQTWTNRRIFLVFDGAMTDTSAKVNGQSAGATHQGGFYRFRYDVTPLVKFDAPNKLEVEVAKHSANESVNRAERQADYWVFGGLFRPVYLEALPAQFIERVAIDARADGNFAMEVFARGLSDVSAVEIQILDQGGKPVPNGAQSIVDLLLPSSPRSAVTSSVSRLNFKLQVERPKLWTAETPNLYSVEVRLKRGGQVLHQVKQRFGFRTFEVRDGDGLYLNGQKIILKGVNRHSFWPDSGRCLSEAVHRLDIATMKDMNMNAVRMSHYPPDAEFLDLCDELGLYVLDELGGWQKYYDTEIGRKLVEETVTRDVNHPSILFWNNGNEGGFNPELDFVFFQFDPQQRRTLHPWAAFNGVNTAHYLPFDKAQAAAGGIADANNPVRYLYLPTEFLHGLYDGGAGAGLEDYWRMMTSSPLCAGGFLWALVDEGLKRPDSGQWDTAGNRAPDGIVGPYREREGSFYTIKEIWSPIVVAPDAHGSLHVHNRYDFTDANQCRFTWQLRKFPVPAEMKAGFSVIAEGEAKVASISPGSSGPLSFSLPTNWPSADVLAIRANDPTGRELWTWSWPMRRSGRGVPIAWLGQDIRATALTATEAEHTLEIKTGDLAVTISKDTGLLYKVARGEQIYSLATGPRPANGAAAPTNFEHKADEAGYAVNVTFAGDLTTLHWRVQSNGWVRCDYRYSLSGPQDYFGVLFNNPETQVKRKRWLGDGPFRVWKNRLRGSTLSVWENDYNDTITGHRGWVYPEFKGCFANVHWLQLETTEGLITVVPENVPFVQVLTPTLPPDELLMKTKVSLPQCGLGFLHGIPPIGTKFTDAIQGGPQGQPNTPEGEFTGAINFYFGTLPRNP